MDGLGVDVQSSMDWIRPVAEASHMDGLGVVDQSNMDWLILKIATWMGLDFILKMMKYWKMKFDK